MFPALIGNLGTPEIIVILVIALLLFGRRLPEVGRSLGRGIVEFKKGVKGIEDDIRDDMDHPDRDIERIPETQKREGFRTGSSGDTSPAAQDDSKSKGTSSQNTASQDTGSKDTGSQKNTASQNTASKDTGAGPAGSHAG